MAMTQLALLFMGSLATLATIGMFVRFDDRWTGVLVTFVAAVIWGLFGLSSYDVIVRDASVASSSEPIMPLVALGVGMAVITGLFGFYDLFTGTAAEASEAEVDLLR